MITDSPRYRIVFLNPDKVEFDIKRALRPGDRVVSVFSVHTDLGTSLRALIELRHPSWEAEKIGWVAD